MTPALPAQAAHEPPETGDRLVIPPPETVEDLIFPEPNTTGEGDLPTQSGSAILALLIARRLKRLREASGLQIKQVAARSKLDVATLSRLENGKILNPKLDTLSRYATACGFDIVVDLVPIDPPYEWDDEGNPV